MRANWWAQGTLLVFAASMPLYALVSLAGDAAWLGYSTAFTSLAWFVFSLSHCAITFGWRRTLLMLTSAFAIALTMEYLGSTYGLIFGAYHYTDRLGPKLLGAVPAIIPIAWFMMLYPAWMLAGVIADRLMTRFIPAQGAARVTIAALAMTAWDLSLDPRMVEEGAWVWQPTDAPTYFGIPLTNFVGWFVTAAAIYVVWWLLRDAPREDDRGDAATLPVIVYAIAWLGESFANLAFWGRPIVGVVTFVAMGAFAVPAVWLVVKPYAKMAHVRRSAAR